MMRSCTTRSAFAALVLVAATARAVDPPVAAAAPEDPSYDLGLTLGGQLEQNGLGSVVSVDALVRGLKDALGGQPVTAAQRSAAQQLMRSARAALAERNRSAAREFLAKNAKEAGVTTTPSGLQYRVYADGDSKAPPPGPADEVTVRYRASLADGTEIDRSENHGQPATFRIAAVIKGWREALLAMRAGAKWQLFVPPELGYDALPPPAIPPGSLLIYELELLRIEAPRPLDPHQAKRLEAPETPAAHRQIEPEAAPH